MDMTALARRLLEPIPAHRTTGIEVLRAVDGTAEIASQTPQTLTNVIGSLHSSGLVALVDAVGLGAIIAASPDSGMEGIVPLGRAASLEFLAPARGRLVATCCLDEVARSALQPLWSGETDRARLSTNAQVADAKGTVVCRGSFDWSVRRLPVSD
jgi:acyl-coenzyme A thioesterase PaaI-like protein